MLVNALFIEMPILIEKTPEKYSIASFLVLGVQVGNFFGFLCAFFQSYLKFRLSSLILFILIFAIFIDLGIVFCWNITSRVAGKLSSVWLVVLFICSGGVGSLSVIVFLPFSVSIGSLQTSGIATGMGANGLLLSLLAMLQKPADQNELFGLETFFLILLPFIILAIIALGLIVFFRNTKPPLELASTVLEEDADIPQNFFEETSNSIFNAAISPILNQGYISLMYYMTVSLTPYMVKGFVGTHGMLYWISLLSVLLGAMGRLLTLWTRVTGYYVFLFDRHVLCPSQFDS
eukprot:TRINITY_DN2219_c0_g1_i3.p1 TRINITY_DN2219_c0_g1~~TRINITY_DN2219_c0_g1_i3.p1  ORF type:complete len:290 (-),score=53.60 TRINITY_DN2219_c0_g1_i3:366-1235(-)